MDTDTKKFYCQSCGMPCNPDEYGTNADGSKNEDYCKYCYENGMFTENCTMDEMMNMCVPAMKNVHPDINEEEARKQMAAFFPTLKRWKTT